MPPEPGAAPPTAQYNFGDNVHIQADVFGGNKWETNVYLLRAAAGPVDWRSYRDRTRAPYRFLDSYDLLDASIYAGREADVDRLESETLAYRLVILQGPVGAGKTSLLRAGLTPRLMSRGYLVLYARDYGDPTAALVAALTEAREQLPVELAGITSLVDLVRAAQRTLERPVVLILDQFESFFTDPRLDAAGRARFRSDLAGFCGAAYPQPVSLILSVRQQSQGELAYFQQTVPDIYHHVVPLDLLTVPEARQAILAPLDGLAAPMVFDPDFLSERLLPDLSIPGSGEACIDPPHLQIVCKTLYDKARGQSQNFINARLYEELGGRDGILGGYVEDALSSEFPDDARRTLARRLLKLLVAPGGELLALSPAEAAERIGQPAALVSEVLETLVRRSLLSARTERTYSLAHPTLAKTVLSWFDPREAELHCAQQAVDRAWYEWVAWDQQRRTPESTSRPMPLLDRGRLPDVARRRDDLQWTPEKRGLALCSAVAAGADPASWVEGMADDEATCASLRELEGDAALAAGSSLSESGRQLGRVVGLAADPPGPNALGRAAVEAQSAVLRIVAGLSLSALGTDALAATLCPPGGRRTPGQAWRLAQTLAAVRAAGRRLPELPSVGLRIAVVAGDRLLRLRAGWRGVLAETLGGAFGAGLAYAARGAATIVLAYWGTPFSPVLLLAYATALASGVLGFALGGVAVLTVRLLTPATRPQEAAFPAWQRVLSLAFGFMLGQAGGLPFEAAYVSNVMPGAGSLLERYGAGAALMGLALGLGWAAAGPTLSRRSVAGMGLAAGAAGLLLGWLDFTTGRPWLPNLMLSGTVVPTLVQAGIYTGLAGAGLAGGWLIGYRFWQRWQALRDRGLFGGG
ncbi:MAG: hypothetical protein NT169_16235 [Chloroflexi bacterium]|nr:hypothetical protein [Chloroflexota bacterium]